MKVIKKIFQILSPNEKRFTYFYFVFTIVVGLLDMLGAASIIPFMTILADPQIINENYFFKSAFEFSNQFGVDNKNDFLFLSGIVVLILYILSISSRALTAVLTFNFVFMREFTISKRLIEGYLHQPYEWFLNKNTSDLGKNILSEVSEIVKRTIMTFMLILAHSTVIIALLILLIIINYKIAISVGLFVIIFYLIVFNLIKKFLSKKGAERVEANTKRYKAAREAFSGLKELKLNGLENFYINQYSKASKIFAKSQYVFSSIHAMPRFFLEAIAFGGMILFTLILISIYDDFSKFAALLVLYAIAGYRIIPGLQQIFSSLAEMRYSEKIFNNIHKDLTELSSNKLNTLSDDLNNKNKFLITKKIKLDKINYHYSNNKKFFIHQLDIEIPAYSKTGIVGSSGSGKTTLIDLILGLLTPISGSIKVDNKIIDSKNLKNWQKSIGYVPQDVYLSDDTLLNNIALGTEVNLIDEEKVINSSKIANLHNFVVKEFSEGYFTKIGEKGTRLSGGQRQRIGIARALYNDPQLLILDEATSALDNTTESEIVKSLENLEGKLTIITIAHRLSTIKNYDQIIFLDDGKITATGTFKELMEKNQKFYEMAKKTIYL